MSSKDLYCYHFSLGSCAFGSSCTFSHDSLALPIPSTVCLYYLRSSCSFGNKCDKTHISIPELVQHLSDKQKESEKLTCSVCLELVFEKPDSIDRQFGMLLNCAHVYCRGCIRAWRHSGAPNSTTCPTCRTDSQLALYSHYFYDDKQIKITLIDQLLKHGLK